MLIESPQVQCSIFSRFSDKSVSISCWLYLALISVCHLLFCRHMFRQVENKCAVWHMLCRITANGYVFYIAAFSRYLQMRTWKRFREASTAANETLARW